MIGGLPLGERREETIGLVVSAMLRADELALFFGDRLRRRSGARAVREALAWRDSSLSEVDKAVLGFVEQMTVDCSQVTQRWIDELRGHGFDDGAILDIIFATSVINCFARVSSALGAPPDDTLMQDGELADLLRGPR